MASAEQLTKALMDAVKNNAVEAVEQCLQENEAVILDIQQQQQGEGEGPEEEADTYSLLQSAAMRGHTKVVQLLLDSCKMSNSATCTLHPYDRALHLALENSHDAVAQLLIGNGLNVNAEFPSTKHPLHLAVSRCTTETIEKLLQAGANVNHRDPNSGENALHVALRADRLPDVTELLIEAGVDVNAQDQYGLHVLHLCAENTASKLPTQLLLAAGADVNAQSHFDKCTPLHYAAMTGNLEVVELLLQQDDVDCVMGDAKGKRPLHWACHTGNLRVVAALTAPPLTPQATESLATEDAFGNTPLHTAMASGAPSTAMIIHRLVQCGANVSFPENHQQRQRDAPDQDDFGTLWDPQAVAEMVKLGTTPSYFQFLPLLFWGARTATTLVHHGADIYLVDEDNCSAMCLGNSFSVEELEDFIETVLASHQNLTMPVPL